MLSSIMFSWQAQKERQRADAIRAEAQAAKDEARLVKAEAQAAKNEARLVKAEARAVKAEAEARAAEARARTAETTASVYAENFKMLWDEIGRLRERVAKLESERSRRNP